MAEVYDIKAVPTKKLVNQWADLRDRIERITEECDELKKEIESRQEIVEGDEAEVIETSKGSYRWKELAMHMKPTEEQIANFTTVAWNKLAEFLIPDGKDMKEAKKQFYDPGTKFFQLRLKRKD